MQPETSPEEAPPSQRGRIVLWGLLGTLAALTLWQWSVHRSFAKAMLTVRTAYADAKAGKRPFTLNEAEALFQAPSRVGPLRQFAGTIVFHQWQGPFRKYTLRLDVGTASEIMSISEDASLPDSDPLARPIVRAPVAPEVEQESRRLMQAYRSRALARRLGKSRSRPSGAAAETLVAWERLPWELQKKFNLTNVETPPPIEDELREKVRLIAAADNRPLIPNNPSAITTVEFNRANLEWYQRHLSDNFKQHADPSASWFPQALEVIENLVPAYADHRHRDAGPSHQEAIQQVLDLGCQDPLFLTLALDVHPDPSQHGITREKLLDAFLQSNYPLREFYLFAMFHIEPKELFLLQCHDAGGELQQVESPLAVPSSLEVQILHDHVLGGLGGTRSLTIDHRDKLSRILKNLVVQTQRSVWLENILLAYYASLGGLDEEFFREMKREGWLQNYLRRTTHFDVNFQPGSEVECELLRRRALAQLAGSVRAWSDRPEIPQGPLRVMVIRNLMELNSWSLQFSSKANATCGPEDFSLAEEDFEFWFREAVSGQLDYAHAYKTYDTRLRETNDLEAQLRLAELCRATNRFDSAVPEFTLDYIAARGLPRHGRRSHPEMFIDTPETFQLTKELLAEYEKQATPPPAIRRVRNYLVGSAFLNREPELAQAQLELLGDHFDASILSSFNLLRSDVERACQPPTMPGFQLPVRAGCRQLAFANNGKIAICLDFLGRVRTFSVPDGKLLTQTSPDEKIEAFAAKATGHSLVTFASDQSATVRDLNSLQPVKQLPADPLQTRLSSDDNQWFTKYGSDALPHPFQWRQHDIESGDVLKEATLEHSLATSAALSEDQTLLITVLESTSGRLQMGVEIQTLDDSTLRLPRWVLQNAFSKAAFSKDGQKLALISEVKSYNYSITWDNKPHRFQELTLLDLETGTVLSQQEHLAEVTALQFIDQDRTLVTAEQRYLFLRDVETQAISLTLQAHNSQITDFAISPDEKWMLSGDDNGQLRLWDLQNRCLTPATPLLPEDLKTAWGNIKFSPDGAAIVRQDAHSTVYWNSNTDDLPRFLPKGVISWMLDGTPVLAAMLPGAESQHQVEVRRLDTDEVLQVISYESKEPPAYACYHAPTHSVITGGDQLTIWNLQTKQPWPWGTLDSLKQLPYEFVFPSNNPSVFAVMTRKGEVHLWKFPEDVYAEDAKMTLDWRLQPANPSAANDLRLSPDAHQLLLCDDAGRLQVHDVETMSRVAVRGSGRRANRLFAGRSMGCRSPETAQRKPLSSPSKPGTQELLGQRADLRYENVDASARAPPCDGLSHESQVEPGWPLADADC